MARHLAFFALAAILTSAACAANEPATGVAVSYQLPADGPLPKTFLVTLAIVTKDNPDWIVSQFLRGAERTVTAENQGKFSDPWDGLDENLMPVPPGSYAVKGICMPARKWAVDDEYHAITPQFVAGASAWMPSREQLDVPEPFGGDPCGAPLADVDVGANGVAVFYYCYLENGTNNPQMDLKKPVGLGQFIRAYNSGGAGGGTSTCTDGHTVWSYSTDGGPKYIYRADGESFGTGRGANRSNVYLPRGWVKAMACWRDGDKAFVYVAQGGKVLQDKDHFSESGKELIDTISIHDGASGKVLGEIPLKRPIGIAARGGKLYAVHGTKQDGFEVVIKTIKAGMPEGEWQKLFAVPVGVTPTDVEVDTRGRVYLSDRAANKVFHFDVSGNKTLTYGRLDAQKPGSYDPQTLIEPAKLAMWTTPEGEDRLIIVEHAGPNRSSEWSTDGKLLREFLPLQTKANDSYCVDPEHPEQVYIGGHGGWLTRFRVDYEKGTWTVDAVWPNIGTDPKAPDFDHPQFIRVNGKAYLACGRGPCNVYRQDGDRWLHSAAIISEQDGKEGRHYAWHDVNGDGVVQDEEYRQSPLEMPGWLLRYHGNQWSDDLSLLALNQAGTDVWRLAPESFDAHGNPIFTKWRQLLTDTVFTARAEGTADALHGGNELDEKFSSDWGQADGTVKDGYYVVARGGKSFSANEGAQIKLSRYVPDGRGGYRMRWRTGRTALQGVARPAEMYGAIHLWKPINGLVSVVDQSRCGIVLFNEDGLYVDSIFPDARRISRAKAGIYPQAGEFFAGFVFADKATGKIYYGMGKYTPLIYEVQGWSLKQNPVKPVTGLPAEVTLNASQIATPPEIALTLRGGAGMAKLARFSPAIGGATLDGSMAGWESCEPVRFQADKDHTVELRALYDPDHLYLRWHARALKKIEAKPVADITRLFSHDRESDTLSMCIQGDVNAKAGGPVGGRPGDVRFIFGLIKEGATIKPVVIGLYPEWKGAGKANPATFRTPVNTTKFDHVGPVADAKLHHVMDAEGKGFVLVAELPRTAIPGLPSLGGHVRTMANFEATFSGHNKFWWSNADGSANRETFDEPTEARLYPGAWAPLSFQGLESGVLVRNWQICGPFGGPGAEKFKDDLSGPMPGTNQDMKTAGREFCEAAKYPPDDGKVDLKATYSGEMVQGYWGKPGAVRWTKATVEDLDTRVTCGPSAQVWYGATWIQVPQDLEIEFRFYGHPQTFLRWFLNGAKVQDGEIQGEPGESFAAKTLTLKKGWNQVLFRGYCVGYPKFRAGLVLTGAPERLWQLRLSAEPPAADEVTTKTGK